MSSEAKHTPGPWEVEERDFFQGDEFIPISADKQMICEVRGNGNNCRLIASDVANARLIAEAPELLEALLAHDLYMLGAGYSGPEDTALHPKAAENWRRVRAVIAKATGAQQ